MDKFATLEPVRLYAPVASVGTKVVGRGQKIPVAQHLIGRLPAELHIAVLSYLEIPDIPAYSRTSRVLAELVRDERVWGLKWKALSVEEHGLEEILDVLETRETHRLVPPKDAVDIVDDEFGDFTSGTANAGSSATFNAISLSSHPVVILNSSKPTFRQRFIRVHSILKPLLPSLSSPPHLILSTLFQTPSPSLLQQSKILHALALYLSSAVKPVRQYQTLYSSLRSAIDRFQANLLTAFDVADGKKNEDGMREAAVASWEVWDGHFSSKDLPVTDWEMGRVWGEKREIFYEQGDWKPLDNFTEEGILDFDSMDKFMEHVLDALQNDGEVAVRVFPSASFVVISFAERLANEVVSEYITTLLTKAREISNEIFLKATAATFREAWRMVDTLVQLNDVAPEGVVFVTKTQAEDVVYRMFETNMDEYLDEEGETLKQALEMISRGWERKVSAQASATSATSPTANARFLGSHNPAQVKRTVLASFTDVLLLPVTIVPRTVGAVGAVLQTGGNAAVQGIAMLNPQRWVGPSLTSTANGSTQGYSKKFEDEGETVFEIGADEDEEEKAKEVASMTRSSVSSMSRTTLEVPAASTAATSITSRSASPTPSSLSKAVQFDQMDLHLSLDVALELIHADRESLKRVETFAGYPGTYGHRVRDTIEEIFILFLQAMGERHIQLGFERATEQMRQYKPDEHEETTSVAPLMQFFELVHIGDTIQSMVQVYFDKELAPHIDKTDFLNAVVREKKRFENVLDDSVAAGMNAGTDVLMNQVEHIILTQTKAREYYPPEDAPLELGATTGCTEAIACLDMHCKLLKGNTSKEVLEVFYQEVGIRLLAILHRHIKRQIISLNGGFQVIADLNAYHTFISSLKVPSIAADFSNLKMLGHVYVVEDAKDLAQIVRDVTRYGGSYRPEDIYEFIQRRADWKKIEKTVDKTMYNLSFKEDCIIC